MIITKLTGGLGNQLFQYALGRSLAIKNNTELKLDVTAHTNNEYSSVRKFALEPFNIKADIASTVELEPFRRSPLVTFLARFKPYYTRKVVYEPFFHFDRRMFLVRNNKFVTGYWQSEKYFKEIAGAIRSEITLKQPLDTSLLKNVGNAIPVSLHVRRGDYVSDPTINQVHGVCSPSYYAQAIVHIKKTIPHPHFFVFSDDTAWVKENISFADPVTYVAGAQLKDYEEMMLMSKCEHYIIANSSFSWWGAWLNPSLQKIVVAPKQWFNDATKNTTDLIPDSWIRL